MPDRPAPASSSRVDNNALQQLRSLTYSQLVGAEDSVGLVQRIHRNATAGRQAATSVAKRIQQVSSRLGVARDRVQEAAQHNDGMLEVVSKLTSALQSVRTIAHKSEDVRRLAEDSRLVALNATIESAHAGEQGKGFAVVAGAIRTLATESALVATDISDTLADALVEFETVVRDTRTAMENSARVVAEVRDLISEASGESEGINQTSSRLVKQLQQDEAFGAEAEGQLAKAVDSHADYTTRLLELFGGSSVVELLPEETPAQLRGLTVIDVRRDEEFDGEMGHLKDATLITLDEDFASKLSDLDRNRPYLFVCRSGGRSSRAATIAIEAGFVAVYNLAGGMLRWRQDVGTADLAIPSGG